MTVLSDLSSAATLGRPSATELGFGLRAADRVTSAAPPPKPLSPLFYCVVLLLLPLLAIPCLIVLGRSDFFLRHGASIWVRSNDSIFSMRNRACDVLVFGDSTAMTGLDPDVLDRDTGLHTCNISVTNAVLAVTDNLTLDHFLRQNAAPRILLVQLSPDDFQREAHSWDRTIYAEGLLELLRHGTPTQIRHTLVHHPRETVAFAGYVAGYSSYYALRSLWSRIAHQPLEEDRIVIRNGFFTPPAVARTSCSPAGERIDSNRRDFPKAWIAALRQRYGDQAGTVLVNVAPIPACDENLPAFRSQLEGLTSNALAGLPVTLFNDDRHYTARGATVVSHLAADELRQIAEQDPVLSLRAARPVLVGSAVRPTPTQP